MGGVGASTPDKAGVVIVALALWLVLGVPQRARDLELAKVFRRQVHVFERRHRCHPAAMSAQPASE